MVGLTLARFLLVGADIVVSLPIIMLVSWFAGRLLGVRRTLLMTLATGFAGWLLGTILALQLIGRNAGTPVGVATQLFCAVVFMIGVQFAVEILRRPDSRDRSAGRRRVRRPSASIRAAVHRSRRYSELVRIAAKHGFGPHLGLRHVSRRTDPERSYGRRLRLALEESGGVFVKLGQALSSRMDLLPPDVAAELSQLQDDVAPANSEAVRAVIEEEFGAPISRFFREFETEPMAAGSIAQVHVATLVDGREVVVKVQRPGIDDLVERDIDALLKLAESLERRSRRLRSFHVAELVGDFVARLREELDFRVEAANTSRIGANLAHLAAVRVPEIHDSLCTRRVLTMEYFHGISVRDFDEAERGIDRQAIADSLLGAYLQQVMVDGVYNADPHPGNILVLDEQQIGLIDFGAVGRLDAVQQEALKQMLLAMGRRDPENLLTSLLDVIDIPVNTDLGRFQHVLASFFNRYLNDEANPSAETFIALLRLLVAHGAVVPAEFGTVFRMFATLQGTIETVAPGYRFTAGLKKVALQAFRGPEHRLQAVAGLVQSEIERWAPLVRRVPRHLDRMATLAERGDLHFRVSLFSTVSDVQTVTRLVNRFILSAVGVGVGVVGVALLATHTGPMLQSGVRLYSVMGGLGLLVSLILILRVTVAVMRDGLN
jgi:ubiquinone biosynthesis protein